MAVLLKDRFILSAESIESSETDVEGDTHAPTDETENTSGNAHGEKAGNISEARPEETTVNGTDSCERLKDANCPSEQRESSERVEFNTGDAETFCGTYEDRVKAWWLCWSVLERAASCLKALFPPYFTLFESSVG